MIEIKCFPNVDGDILIREGKLVSYESYEINGHPTAYPGGFYWKLDVQDDYFNFNCSEIDSYRVIKSSIPESPFPELTVCKDLIWMMFHGGSVHIYENHVDQVREQINKPILDTPTLEFRRKPADIFSYELSDFELKNYIHADYVPAEVSPQGNPGKGLLYPE